MNHLSTEKRNASTQNLDEMSIQEALAVMNKEDQKVALCIEQLLPQLAEVVTITTQQFNNGGRIIYIGAGTSGRLGVLDAAECVPTFNTTPQEVVGIIAGGQEAMTKAVEGAEDSEIGAENDLKNINLSSLDVVIGIAASGRTPYVKGGLKYAQSLNARTVSIACNTNAEISNFAQYPIEVDVGPEVLTGSTRLKSGTAQKLILNMISTITMVGAGKVYGNLMVDVKPTNNKLNERAIIIIQEICNIDAQLAQDLYDKAQQNLKVAVVMYLCDLDANEALNKLNNNNGIIKEAIK
ncbi:N-acetylmuramic acid 6-phosphate etherase [Staphylococcus durrellii]|uniref:N-acetylmuramic acid 6-phosphate etherase n=1 Tax=Staphylococcus durrellii TaxID=2781773 RepID=UPI00189FA54C|nr:N-acetylmuramic acid 6-phosphate etherase [Staphylococcus durrellii]MBF7016403.1 N-acetylmuramic acid 6-phosphate etherase [Staphylococcus durrellii]